MIVSQDNRWHSFVRLYYIRLGLNDGTLTQLRSFSASQVSQMCEMKLWCIRPLLCTLFRLNWAKQTPGIMRRN